MKRGRFASQVSQIWATYDNAEVMVYNAVFLFLRQLRWTAEKGLKMERENQKPRF